MRQVAPSRVLCLLVVILCLLTVKASGAVFHVSPSGSNTPPYDSYATAAHTPRDAALASSGAGDTILIHTGTHDIDTTIDLPVGVALIGTGRDSVSLVYQGILNLAFMFRARGDNEFVGIEFVNPIGDGAPATRAILQAVSTGYLTIHGCRFDKSGINCSSPAPRRIYDNEFLVFSGEGIIASSGGSIEIHDNFFRSGTNISGAGVGISANGGDVVIDHNVFDWRPARDNGTPVHVDRFPARVVVRNNLILGGNWSILWTVTDGVIENNTIVRPANTDEGGIAVFQLELDTLVMRNNALIDFAGLPGFGGECPVCPPRGTVNLTHNAYWPPVDSFYNLWDSEPWELTVLDAANFNGFPMFIDDSLYHLQFGSPLTDAGDPSILDVDGSRSDIGWTGGPGGVEYEYNDLPPLPPESLVVTGEDTLILIDWTPRPEADLAGYRLYRGSQPGFWSPEMLPTYEFGVSVGDALDQVSRAEDTLYYVVTSFDLAGQESVPSAQTQYIISDHPFNRPPVWSPVAPQEVAEGDTLQLRVTAADPDGDALILTVVTLPVNATFDDSANGTGLLEFRPDTTQAGDYVIEVVASDGVASDTAVIAVSVRDAAAPPPPTPGIVKTYPNPLSTNGSVEIFVPGDAATTRPVKVVLHDLLGRTIVTCFDGALTGGVHVIELDLSEGRTGLELASGIYFLRLQDGAGTIGGLAKIVILK